MSLDSCNVCVNYICNTSCEIVMRWLRLTFRHRYVPGVDVLESLV